MHQSVLLSCALSTTTLLDRLDVPHAFFGGFATTMLGCRRETKDIDIIVSVSKSTLVALLSSHPDWLEIPHTREDYVAYLWKGLRCPTTNSGPLVLVEFFPLPPPDYRKSHHRSLSSSSSTSSFSSLSSSSSSSSSFANTADTVDTFTFSTSNSASFPHNDIYFFRHYASSMLLPLLPPSRLFVGKLSATTRRSKPSDLQDLLFLLRLFPRDIERALRSLRTAAHQPRFGRRRALQSSLSRAANREAWLSLHALATRSPELRASLVRAGVKLVARPKIEPVVPIKLVMEAGAVQRGIMCC